VDCEAADICLAEKRVTFWLLAEDLHSNRFTMASSAATMNGELNEQVSQGLLSKATNV
jgi:hypothetical protein